MIPTNEPDLKAFHAHGTKCLIRRTPMGHLCGYVKVPNGHPMWKELKKKGRRTLLKIGGRRYVSQKCGYDRKLLRPVDCHGGLTYSGRMRHYVSRGLWVGFDCAHYDDLVPGLITQLKGLGCDVSHHFESGTYKDLAFVEAQCRSVAKQIMEVTT